MVKSLLQPGQLRLFLIETILSSVSLVVHIQLKITEADILFYHLSRSFMLNALY